MRYVAPVSVNRIFHFFGVSGYSESHGNPEEPAVADLLFQAVSEEATAPGKEHPALFLLMMSMWNPPRLLVFCKVCRLGPGSTLKRLWSMQKERESARTCNMACGSGGTRTDFVPTCGWCMFPAVVDCNFFALEPRDLEQSPHPPRKPRQERTKQERIKSRHPNCPISTCPFTALISRQETMNDPTLSWSGVPFFASCRFHCLTASIQKQNTAVCA